MVVVKSPANGRRQIAGKWLSSNRRQFLFRDKGMMTRGASDKFARRFLKYGRLALSLAAEAFLDDIVLDILKSGVPREKICFEITETAAIPNLLWRRNHLKIDGLSVKNSAEDPINLAMVKSINEDPMRRSIVIIGAVHRRSFAQILMSHNAVFPRRS